MRIIAGTIKGRKLFSPKGHDVRPTTDKVKEALFSVIQAYIPDANVCDLFAGTGNLGLEALSRGAKHCWFGDHAGDSIKLIEDNIAHCGMESCSTVIHGGYSIVLSSIREKIDIFFLDPPYRGNMINRVVNLIREKSLLAEGGIIVVEHHRGDVFPEELSGFRKVKEKKYGRVVLSIYM